MRPAYPEWDYNGSDPLARVATKLYTARPRPSRLSPLVMMTDPKRMSDVVAAAKALPERAAIIYRHFGKDNREDEARVLRQITFEKHQQLLIGNDPELAIAVGADGVHFRRDAAVASPALWRSRCPDWLITMAGLKVGNYTGDLSVLDGLFISSIFESQSPSAGTPVGIDGLKTQLQTLPCPVFALGGINAKTAHHLTDSGAAGLAAIGGLMNGVDIKTEVTDEGYRLVGHVAGIEETAELTLRKVSDNLYNANHTGVPKSMGGKGVGKALVKALSDHARSNDYKVIPGCPFVGVMWKRHPDWAEGVAASKT